MESGSIYSKEIMKMNFRNIDKYTVGFLILLAFGVFLRIFKLGILPIGLNADEASIGYEAYSLLKTGADRWGIKLPPYFLSFGSGQNTLYAYLSVPFLYFFDLSQTSIRLLSATLGLATLPLVYYLAKMLLQNRIIIFICVILYLFDPYLFMISRWALEYNILPFFVLLSILIFNNSFKIITENNSFDIWQKTTILVSFPTLALIIYTYASAIFIIPFFILLVFIYFWKEIWANKKLFSFSILLFLVLLSPFILFILKNHILKTAIPFEQYLPFEIPKMLSNREEVYKGLGKNLAIIKKNFIFLFSGFKEFDRAFNTTKFYQPHLFLLFSLVGLSYLGYNSFSKQKKHFAILFFWSICCLVPFLFFEMNLNRSVHLQAVIPILAALGLYFVFENIVDFNFRKYLTIALFVLFSFQSVLFFGEYFNRFPSYDQFEQDFEPAIKAANSQKKGEEKIAVSAYLVFNYLFVNFYQKYPPAQFQKTLKANYTHPNVAVYSYDGYYILGDFANEGYYLNLEVFEKLLNEKSFLALLRSNEKMEDYKVDEKSLINPSQYSQTIVHNSGAWKVVRFTRK
jgi:4-amino-4-deoxy-L-arabinose transferase-like glycosyltransferase